MKLRKNAVLVALLCVGATGLAGCGGNGGGGGGSDDPFAGDSADQIADQAVKATQAASSVRMAGTAKQNGDATITVDFQVDERDRCKGKMSGQGATAQVVRTGEQLFVQGDRTFWSNTLKGQPGAEQALDKLKGRWVKTAPNEQATEGMCDKQAFLAAMDSDKSERSGMKKTGTTTINGKKAVTLEKKKENGEKFTVHVAAEGKPYLLKTVTEGGKAPSEMTFSAFNEKVDAQEPPADQVVDPKTLGKPSAR